MELLIAVLAVVTGLAALALAYVAWQAAGRAELAMRSAQQAVEAARRDLAGVADRLAEPPDVSPVHDLRGELTRVEVRLAELERVLASAKHGVEAVRSEQATQKEVVESLRSEMQALRQGLEVTSLPPPVPRPRTASLDDLRAQLRAAQSEDDEDET